MPIEMECVWAGLPFRRYRQPSLAVIRQEGHGAIDIEALFRNDRVGGESARRMLIPCTPSLAVSLWPSAASIAVTYLDFYRLSWPGRWSKRIFADSTSR